MNLKEYITWAKTLDAYKDGEKLANINAWGFEKLERVNVPNIKIETRDRYSRLSFSPKHNLSKLKRRIL